MAKTFRAIKASFIMGILLVSILAVSIPSISAGLFLNAEQDVVLTADVSAIQTEFKPVGGAYFIPINISVAIRGLLSKIIEKIFEIKYQLGLTNPPGADEGIDFKPPKGQEGTEDRLRRSFQNASRITSRLRP